MVMLQSGVIQKSIDDLNVITGMNLTVTDALGKVIASTDRLNNSASVVAAFIEAIEDDRKTPDGYLVKIYDDMGVTFLLEVVDPQTEKNNLESDDEQMIARIAASQIKALMAAYGEKYNKASFYQNLVLDNMLLVDIYNQAKKLKISPDKRRAAIIVEGDGDEGVINEILKGMFPKDGDDAMVSVDEKGVVIIKTLNGDEDSENLEALANIIIDMVNMEAMTNARVSFGNIVSELKDVSKSYKEAKMALEVGRIFYADKKVIPYDRLGIGRLIYQLPYNLCEIFIKEYFGDAHLPEEIDEEILTTIKLFFENNLNISETSRQLYIHRNTLVYRIEKLQKATGLDMRVFEDALTFRIALMVSNYLQYLEKVNA